MFYIIREYHSGGGGLGVPFHSWYEYEIDVVRPSNKSAYVTAEVSKENLKELITEKGSLQDALEHLYTVIEDCNKVDYILDKK